MKAGSALLPALAAAHLVFVAILTKGAGLNRHAGVLAAGALGVLAVLVARDLLPERRRDRLPGVEAALAWGAAGLLELHAILPPLAASRLVPAVLFPLFAFCLRPAPLAAWGLAALGWLVFNTGRGWPPEPGIAVGLVFMAALGTAGGTALRRLSAARPAPGAPRRDGGTFRRLLLSWSDPGEKSPGTPEAADDADIVRRAGEIGDGVRRILEGLLPLSGGSQVSFVVRSADPGQPFRVACAASRDPGGRTAGETIPDSFPPLREAFLFRRAFMAEGAEAASYGPRAEKGGQDPAAIAAVPVLVDGRIEGALLALRRDPGPWSEPIVPLLEMGAFFAAREVEAGRRLRDEARSRIRQDAFHALFRKVTELAERGEGADPSDPSLRREIYDAVVLRIREHLGVARVLLVEAEERTARGRLVAVAADGAGAGARTEAAARGGKGGSAADSVSAYRTGGEEGWIPIDGSYLDWVFRNGVTRSFTSLGTAPPKRPVFPHPWSDPSDEACLLVPVTGAGGFRGILACASTSPRPFPAADADAALDFLRVLRMALSHVRQLEELGTRATVDGLTGLLNRKTFLERLTGVLGRLDGRHPAALVMLDLDHFKRINDTHGHPAGDEVLRKTASVIGKAIRKLDFAGRYGGEEFIVFLGQADRDHALQAAERLRLAVRKTRFLFGGREGGVTASLGVACYPLDGLTAAEMVRKADEALYRSKEGGRDRVTCAQGSDVSPAFRPSR